MRVKGGLVCEGLFDRPDQRVFGLLDLESQAARFSAALPNVFGQVIGDEITLLFIFTNDVTGKLNHLNTPPSVQNRA